MRIMFWKEVELAFPGKYYVTFRIYINSPEAFFPKALNL